MGTPSAGAENIMEKRMPPPHGSGKELARVETQHHAVEKNSIFDYNALRPTNTINNTIMGVYPKPRG